jgi:hypothetical protein
LGINGPSKSQVSMMARDLDELVRDFRERPLDASRYTFLAADALTMPDLGRSVRAAGRSRPRRRSPRAPTLMATARSSASRPPPPSPAPGGAASSTTCRPRPERSRAGHLRRPHRTGRRDRGKPARARRCWQRTFPKMSAESQRMCGARPPLAVPHDTSPCGVLSTWWPGETAQAK